MAEAEQHTVDMAVSDKVAETRRFRAECSCGWNGPWATTNACMGSGRRHVSAKRRAAEDRAQTEAP